MLDLLDKDRPLGPLGKKLLPRSNSNFEFSILRTWSKLVIGLKVALGRAVRKLLYRLSSLAVVENIQVFAWPNSCRNLKSLVRRESCRS
jgi:hypothetical protein